MRLQTAAWSLVFACCSNVYANPTARPLDLKAPEPNHQPNGQLGVTQHSLSSSEKNPNTDLTTRMNFVLGTPRRYGVRFDAKTRALEIRVTPARADEFEPAAFYDGRLVHRVITQERGGEVYLTIQLRNAKLEWLVTHQESPWRLIVDVWGQEKTAKENHMPWVWDGFYSSQKDRRMQNYVAAELINEDAPRGYQALQQSPAPEAGRVASAVTAPGDALGEDADGEQASGPGIDLPEAKSQGPSITANRSQEQTPPSQANSGTNNARASQTPQTTSSLQPSSSQPTDARLSRYLAAQPALTAADSRQQPSLARAAKQAYMSGAAAEALRIYRRYASLNQTEFTNDPEAMWLAGESALAAGQNDAARDYFRTLVQKNRKSTYAYYGDLRLLDLDPAHTAAGDAQQARKTDLNSGYMGIVNAQGAPWIAKGVAALRLASAFGPATETPSDGAQQASLMASLEACSKEPTLDAKVRQECAYNMFVFSLRRADLLSAQALIADYKKNWKDDARIQGHKQNLSDRITTFAETLASADDFARWNQLEKKTDPLYLKGTDERPALLAKRAQAWQQAGNSGRAIALYKRAADRETDTEKVASYLVRLANLAAKNNQVQSATEALTQVKGLSSSQEKGLSAEDYSLVKEIALPPVGNRIAAGLVLDDINRGFHAENDVRTLVTLAERLDGAREADILYEKLLAIPSRSSTDVELKEDALMNYAETLRNQGRLVKSADTFLAVANLDNGKNRAEAAYKAGVIYFRAGLLEKATSSWNIAANDLDNSKYSALATERLNRIR